MLILSTVDDVQRSYAYEVTERSREPKICVVYVAFRGEIMERSRVSGSSDWSC